MSDATDTAARALPDAQERRPRRMSPALLQRRVRQIHLYVSMLFAPSLIFFALTGALQLFDLHETKAGRSFDPPAVFQELGMAHKKQVFALPRRRPPAEGSSAAAPSPPPAAPTPAAPPQAWTVSALKIFFLFAAIGLFVSTCLGIWVGLQQGRSRGAAIGLLVVGTAIPVLLLAM